MKTIDYASKLALSSNSHLTQTIDSTQMFGDESPLLFDDHVGASASTQSPGLGLSQNTPSRDLGKRVRKLNVSDGRAAKKEESGSSLIFSLLSLNLCF